MGRPAKAKPNRADGRFKVTRTIGTDKDGKKVEATLPFAKLEKWVK